MKSFVIVKVLVVSGSGRVLLIRRSATDERRPLQWDFPGGFIDDGEDILAAAVRETKEETGLEVALPTLVFAMSQMTPAHGAGTWIASVARIDGEPDATLSYEHDQFMWAHPKDLLTHITYDRQQKMLHYVLKNKLLESRK